MYFEITFFFLSETLVANEVQTNNSTDYLQTTHRQTGNTVLSLPHKFVPTLYQKNPARVPVQAPWSIQLPGFVPSDNQQALDSAHYLLGTALRSRLASFRFTAKTQVLANRWFYKRNSLNVGMYSLFCVCLKVGGTIPYNCVNQAIMSFMFYKNDSCVINISTSALVLKNW